MEARFIHPLRVAVFAFFACYLVWAVQADVQAAPAMPINALIELNVNSITQTNDAITFIESQGGEVPLSFAPSALLAYIPPSVDLNSWLNRIDIHAVYQGNVNLTTSDPQAQLAATVWNHWQQEHPFSLDAPAVVQASQVQHAHKHTAHDSTIQTAYVQPARQAKLDWVAQANCDDIAVNRFPNPNCFQTSEYLVGSHQVDLFLPESSVASNNTEDWSTQRRDEVVIGVASGLLWWVAVSKEVEPAPRLSYNLTVHDPFTAPDNVATDHEPILTHSQRSLATSEDGLWIGQLMENMGYLGSNQYPGIPEHLVAMWQFVDARRQAMARDWGFLIFVADSLNDDDGYFAGNTTFAYAGRPGPHMVLTYDNGPNSQQLGAIGGIKINLVHELGHIFDAPEEYQVSCNPTENAGYFNVSNSNCENGGLLPLENSVMRSPLNQRSAFTNVELPMSIRRMAGWQDSDSDGLVDPLDTTPSLHINGPILLTDGRHRYEGSTVDIAFSVPTERITRTTRTPSTINTIVSAEYRLDGQSWQPCLFDDGSFIPNVSSANFACEFILPSGEGHMIEFRSQNSAGNYSQTLVQNLDGQPSMDTAPQGAISLSGGADNVLGSPTAHLVLSAIDNQTLLQESDYRLQYDGVWQAWEPYQGYVYTELDNINGEHPIAVQYRDNAGNASPEYHTTLLLDQESPTCAISDIIIDPTNADVTLKFANSDEFSSVTKVNLHYYDETIGESRWHGWNNATEEATINLSEDNLYDLTVRCLDRAYNQGQANIAVTVDRGAPGGRIQDIDVVWQDGQVEATIDFVASDTLAGITQYRLYYNETWQAWQSVDVAFTFAETAQVIIDPTGEVHTFQVQFMDGAGNVSRIDIEEVELRNVAPEGAIKDVEKQWVGDQLNAKIHFIGSSIQGGLNGYRLYYNGEWQDWVATDVTYALTDSSVVGIESINATHTIQIQFRDTRGNTSRRHSFALQVGTSDRSSPTGSITLDSIDSPVEGVNELRTVGEVQLTLTLEAQDQESEITQMKIFDGTTWGEWEPFATTWSAEVEDGTYDFSVQFRDAANNVSEVIQLENVVVDTVPPAGSMAVTILNGSAQAELRFQIDTAESLETLQTRLFYNNIWHEWEAYTATKVVDLTQQGLQDFQVEFRDAAQNLSDIYIVPDQPVDTRPPTSSVLRPNGEIKIVNPTVEWMGWDNADGSGIDCYDVQYSTDFGVTWIDWLTCVEENSAQLSGDFGQIYYIRVRAIDNVGNQEAYPDGPDVIVSITPDFEEPEGTAERSIYLPIIYGL